MRPVSVHNEWDPLEEIIVGTAIGAQFPKAERSFQILEFPQHQLSDMPSGPFPDFVIEETEEDLEALVAVLKKLNVRVRRPDVTDLSKSFGSSEWQSSGLYNYCPRDILLCVDDMIIESPSPLRARYFEVHAYQNLLIEYMQNGCRWLSAPKGRLADESYLETGAKHVRLGNLEPAFDAANVLRMGEDLLYLVSSTGNELGCQWLQSILGSRYRVHPLHDLYVDTHIDSTITLLRPGLVLINSDRVPKHKLPAVFKNWDVLWSPEVVDIGYTGQPYATKWIGLNFLMVNPNLAIVDKNQLPLIKALESHRIEVIPLELRHARTLGGGFHCVTLDVVRKGSLENYL